jgi:hypothetical protein
MLPYSCNQSDHKERRQKRHRSGSFVGACISNLSRTAELPRSVAKHRKLLANPDFVIRADLARLIGSISQESVESVRTYRGLGRSEASIEVDSAQRDGSLLLTDTSDKLEQPRQRSRVVREGGGGIEITLYGRGTVGSPNGGIFPVLSDHVVTTVLAHLRNSQRVGIGCYVYYVKFMDA